MTTAPAETTTVKSQRTTFPITRLGTLTNYFLVVVLIVTFITGPVAVLYQIVPSPLLVFIPLVCALVSIESMVTARWINAPERRQMNHLLYRAAEWVVILVVLRLLVWAMEGGLPTLETFYDYLVNPLNFLDTRFMAFAFFSLVAWDRAETFSTILRQISLTDQELDFYALPAYMQSVRAADQPVDPQRTLQFQKLISNWIFGGLVLVTCAAITTFQVPEPDIEGVVNLRNISRLGLRPELLVSLLIYFLTGLWLIARARLVTLRTRWIVSNIEVQPGLERVWNGASLLVLLVVAALATLLPIGSTTGAARILGAIATFFLFLVNLFLLLLSLLIFLLLSILGQPSEQFSDNPLAEPLTRPTPQPLTPPSETTAIILGSLFWLVVIGVVVVAFIFFLRGRGVRLEGKKITAWWHRFVAWLRHLWHGAADRIESLSISFRREKKDDLLTDKGRSPWRFIRVNALSAQEQIRYFYLSIIRRADEKGVHRKDSETPSEFVNDLKEGWPEIDEEIDALTAAFLRARYSGDRFVDDDVPPVKKIWQQVRASIRRRRNRSTGE